MTGVIVALDYADLSEALDLAEGVADAVDGFKVGLELLMGHGPDAISTVAGIGLPVFADAKLHDIPNTVRSAARQIEKAGARWVTVHASGGETMMRAAVEGMGGRGVLAVTVLTSLGPDDLAATGIPGSLSDQVMRLARVAGKSGVEGLVCSPLEAAQVRDLGISLELFTPGIRPAGHAPDDQRRVETPEKAAAAGSDYVIVGRPITGASDPLTAAREIVTSLAPSAQPRGG